MAIKEHMGLYFEIGVINLYPTKTKFTAMIHDS